MIQKFHLSGMTCQSCEVVIEREVKKLSSVSKASVSHKAKTLRIDCNKPIDPKEILSLIERHGYGVSKKPIEKLAMQKTNWKRVGGILVLVFAAYFVLSKTGVLNFSPTTGESAGLFAILVIGLIASVSSCTAVVGGLVVAVSSQMAKEQVNQTKAERLRPHILFNIGRLLGFALFGAFIGLLGSSIELGPTMNGLFVFAIAIFMILLGVNLLELFPNSVVRTPKWISHKIHDLSESRSLFAPVVLGGLTFFLPCGFTQSMQLYALSLQDPIQSSLVMSVFALGTLPALLGIGSLTSFAPKKTLSRITKVAGALVLILGISNAVNGAALLGFNPSSAFAKVSMSPLPTITNGKQYIQMEITDNLEYAPNVLMVRKDLPVEWQIFGGEFLGCANSLVSPRLGINAYLRSGINTVRFTPTKTGKFTFSCSMGMFRGTMIVTDNQT